MSHEEQLEALLTSPTTAAPRRRLALLSLNGPGAVTAAAVGAPGGDGVESYDYRGSDSAAEAAVRGGGASAAAELRGRQCARWSCLAAVGVLIGVVAVAINSATGALFSLRLGALEALAARARGAGGGASAGGIALTRACRSSLRWRRAR